MSDKEWFDYFDKTKDSFKWFFEQYSFSWSLLMVMREKEDRASMMSFMNTVWFELPDGRFNIMSNPKGWYEFINLIEE